MWYTLEVPTRKSGQYVVVITLPGGWEEAEWWPGVAGRNIGLKFWGDSYKDGELVECGWRFRWGHSVRFTKWSGGVESNCAEEKADWHAWRTDGGSTMGVRLQQRIAMEWEDVYVLWFE